MAKRFLMTNIIGSVMGILLVTTLAVPGAARASTPDRCHDPAHDDHASRACKIVRLRERSWVVIATVDSGINPYHVDFRVPEGDDLSGIHPSEFIEGYPAETAPLDLTFEAPSLNAARSLDGDRWGSIAPGEMRWIPGTNVIGGVSPQGGDFFDTGGHGTAVSSVAGGRIFGRGGPDILLVAVAGRDDGWRWAAEQPWIDLISISWSLIVPGLDESAEASYEAAAAGKLSCVATGNLAAPLWFWEAQGPSWNVNVGAVDAEGQVHPYSGNLPDVVAFPDLTVATHTSMTATRTFSGTSGAAPHVCAQLGRTIAGARARLGDTLEGPHGGGFAIGAPGPGPLADGVLSRTEVEDSVQVTARPLPGEAAWLRSGYGIVETETTSDALSVLFGERPRPDRAAEDLWIGTTDQARDLVYGPGPSGVRPSTLAP